MANAEVLLANEYDFFSSATSGANSQLDVTIAAPSTDKEHIVQGVEFSLSAAPATAIEVQVIEDAGGTPVVKARFQVPAAAVAPVSVRYKGFSIAAGKSVTLRVPAAGGTTVSSGTIMGMTRFAS